MIDPKIEDRLILCRDVLTKPQASGTSQSPELLQNLILCRGIAELALAAICVHLDCVPDKKTVYLSDYFVSLAKTSLAKTTTATPAIAGGEFLAELDHAICESQFRFHLPAASRWTRVHEETLELVSGWCRQTLHIDLFALENANGGCDLQRTISPTVKSEKSQAFAGRVAARYPCAGSVDIRLSRSGRSEKGALANLSLGGCNVRSNFIFKVGEKIELVLEVNGTSFRVSGRVAHVPSTNISANGNCQSAGIGVRFENMTAGALIQLKNLIRELQAKALWRQKI